MRGDVERTEDLFSYVALADRVPSDHPLRSIRAFVDPILRELSPRFDAIYAKTGRPSIPPEQLLKALLLQVLYTVRSERMLCEQLEYNLLFRWFVGLGLNERAWVPTVFTKNRDRLLRGDIAEAFFQAVVREARRRNWLSDEHFTVDGTLLEAWASQKSFRPRDELPPSDGTRNPDVNFRGEKRSNETHRSTTDPDARLAKKALGKESKLSYQANVLRKTETGSSSIPSFCIRRVRLNVRQPWRCCRLPKGKRRRTLGADKGYDTRAFVAGVRARGVTPHVASTAGAVPSMDGRRVMVATR